MLLYFKMEGSGIAAWGRLLSIVCIGSWLFSRKIFFEYLSDIANLTFMRNYRRLSGDGSVKVVLSGDSNSPPKTTSRREPPSYNSSPTQELRTPPAIAFAFLRVHSRFQKNVDFSIGELLKFQKKPVFALIRGLFSSPGEFPNVDVCPSQSLCLRASVVKVSQSQNADSPRSPFPPIQNPFRKARKFATTFREANVNAGQHYRGGLGKPHVHVSTLGPNSVSPYH
jgi:hypothetical protein